MSRLFEDHPDLLMEFTYFLPDAVQEQVIHGSRIKTCTEELLFVVNDQAKERLSRAVREAEMKRAKQSQQGVSIAQLH